MEALINEYISRELVQDASLLPLGNAAPLLETGIVDSLGLLRLVVFIQQQFGITVDDADLVPENFDSVEAISSYLRSRDGGRANQAGGPGEQTGRPAPAGGGTGGAAPGRARATRGGAAGAWSSGTTSARPKSAGWPGTSSGSAAARSST